VKGSIFALAAVAISASMADAPAIAGQSDTAFFRGLCRLEPPLFTVCRGTFAGIRANTDGSSFARFDMDTNGALRFVMRINRVIHSCSAPSTMTDLWKAAMSGAGYFSVEIDANDVCARVVIGAGSNLKNDTAL
jgi:hypothetical protein